MANKRGNSGNSDLFYWLQNHCRWWPQPWNSKTLAHWKKSYDKPRQSIKKQSHYTADKGQYSQRYSFSSIHKQIWELKYTERWVPRNWCFWTVCCRRLLWVLWTAKRSNQSILKEISPEYSLEGLMLKLKLQYFSHLMWRADSLEKAVMLVKTEGRRGRQRMRKTDSMHKILSKFWGDGGGQGNLDCCSPWGCKVWATTEQLNNNSIISNHLTPPFQ